MILEFLEETTLLALYSLKSEHSSQVSCHHPIPTFHPHTVLTCHLCLVLTHPPHLISTHHHLLLSFQASLWSPHQYWRRAEESWWEEKSSQLFRLVFQSRHPQKKNLKKLKSPILRPDLLCPDFLYSFFLSQQSMWFLLIFAAPWMHNCPSLCKPCTPFTPPPVYQINPAHHVNFGHHCPYHVLDRTCEVCDGSLYLRFSIQLAGPQCCRAWLLVPPWIPPSCQAIIVVGRYGYSSCL